RWMPEACTLLLQLGIQGIDIVNGDPQPGAGLSLITLDEHRRCPVSMDRRDRPIRPVVRESEDVHVVGEALGQVSNPQDRDDSTERGTARYFKHCGLIERV